MPVTCVEVVSVLVRPFDPPDAYGRSIFVGHDEEVAGRDDRDVSLEALCPRRSSVRRLVWIRSVDLLTNGGLVLSRKVSEPMPSDDADVILETEIDPLPVAT